MENYLLKTKNSLINAKMELENVIKMLEEIAVIDNEVIQKKEINVLLNNCNKQIKNITNIIIPAARKIGE